MKKYILLFICLFLLYLPSVSAQNLTGKVTASNGIKVRSMPTTNSKEIDDGLANGRTVTILETVKSDDSKDACASKVWYKIVYQYSNSIVNSFIRIYKYHNFDFNIDDRIRKSNGYFSNPAI